MGDGKKRFLIRTSGVLEDFISAAKVS